MVASNDVVTAVSVIANLALVITVVFLAYQVKLQRNEIKRDSYDRLMSSFTSSVEFLASHPVIEKYLPSYKFNDPPKIVEEKLTVFYYLDMLISTFERVWTAKEEKRLYENSWLYWRDWIKQLAANPIFVEHFNQNKKEYSPSFIAEVDGIINELKK